MKTTLESPRLPRFSRLIIGIALLAAASGWAYADTAIVNVTIIPMDSERILPGHTVVVAGERIDEIGPSATLEIADDVRRIDGTGKYLIPGLAEMHGHNPPPGSSEEYIANIYFLFVANGVTTVRSMLGWPGQLELRDRVKRGEIMGPTLYLAGPSFSGASIRSPAQAQRQVNAHRREGWDLLKVHPGLTRANFDAMARAADAAEIRFAGHVPAEVGLAHAIYRGQETIDHLDGYIEFLNGDSGPLSSDSLQAVVELTKQTGTWVVPTMALWETIIGAADLDVMLDYPELKYMPTQEVKNWEASYRRRIGSEQFDPERARRIAANRMVLLKALNEAGARIIFGTDAPQQFSVPGFSVHREIERMAECGLRPYEILRTATYNVGNYLRGKERSGTITVGNRADLILLESNPLDDLTNLRKRAGVMVRGQWLEEADIQGRLREIAASAR